MYIYVIAFILLLFFVITLFTFLLQIPEEEKDLNPHDHIIHVYHFIKDTPQNQVGSIHKWLVLLYIMCIFSS
ncbi:putative ubiquitinyl hydrolase 1 [Helianthus annuus]|nr:putative ubiquitinyl hydrolase 1 [Helianthus annuus]